MRLTFIGSGDAFGSGGRFNTCFLVEAEALTFLIDCGASSLVALKQRKVSLDAIDAVLISHLHGDHFGGLPFFILDARYVHKRSRPLLIAGPPGTRDRLNAALEVLFPGASRVTNNFELTVAEFAVGAAQDVLGIGVSTYEVIHPSGAPSLALRLELEGKVITYSGDSEWTPALIDAARGADLFICECYAPAGDIPMHMSYEQVIGHIGEFGARRVVLTHMGETMLPQIDRIDRTLCEPACDGMTIEL